jgi:RES domain-containing protein
MLVYRIAPEEYALEITGEGARLNGGRWNEEGLPAIYTAMNPSLAMLEVIAFYAFDGAPSDLVMVTLEIPDDVNIEQPDMASFPKNWNARPFGNCTQAFGSIWLQSNRSACLQVPSVLMPKGYGWNLILNPLHPLLEGNILVAKHEPIGIDDRIARQMGKRL